MASLPEKSNVNTNSQHFITSVNLPLAALKNQDYLTQVASSSDTPKLPTGTRKSVAKVTITSGTWLILGRIDYPANATGRRYLGFTTTEHGQGWRTNQTACTKNTLDTVLNSMIIYTNSSSSPETIYLNGYQDSGSSLTVTYDLTAIRIG